MQFFKKHYWIEFNKGDETLGSEPYGISFDKEGDSNIPRNFKSLHETGIVPWIEAKFHASKFAGRKPIANERKEINPYIKIEGGIGTLFILFVALNCVALSAFLVEICVLCKKRALLWTLWWWRKYLMRNVCIKSYRCSR